MENISYFISISVKCIFGRYNMKLQKINIYMGTETTIEKNGTKFLFFYLKDFIFNK